MTLEIKVEQHICRVCLQYSTETVSVHDQAAAGVSYLDLTLKLTNQLQQDGSRNESLHICEPCANMAKSTYDLNASYEGADYKMEIEDGIFIEEKKEAVKIEDESISNYRNSGLNPTESNYAELPNTIKVEKFDENSTMSLDDENTNPSNFEILVKIDNCFFFPLKEEANIKSEHELETFPENKNDAWTAFVCKICDKKFAQVGTLRRHNKVAHNLHQTACYFCDFLPESSDELTSHIAQEHADKKSGACKECGKTFFDQQSLKRHLLVHKGIKNHTCNVCDNKFTSKLKLMEHVRRHTGEKPFSCSKCDKKFSHSSTLRKHMTTHEYDSCDDQKSTDRKTNTYDCKMCDKKFLRLSSRRRHSKVTHNTIEPCYYCEYVPASTSDLAKHTKKEHADKKNFACDLCKRTFFDVETLNVHLFDHSGGVKSYECEMCSYKCTAKPVFMRHMRKHRGEKSFQCSECGQTFRDYYNLKKHLANKICRDHIKKANSTVEQTARVPSKMYDCKLCDRKFSGRRELCFHTKTVHNNNELSCYFCDYMPDSLGDLRQHTEKEHADRRTLICEHCNKAFFELVDLKRHLTIHNTVRNYVCKICGYKFVVESALIEHMTIHTGETPFECYLCDKSFRLQASLNKHISTH